MKATGIVRRIDDLGRVVIPKEIRRILRIREGDPLEIYTAADGEVIFKKYSPLGEIGTFAGDYAEVLAQNGGHPVVVCDRDHVIAVAGCFKREWLERRVSPALNELMEQRRYFPDDALQPVEGVDHYVLCGALIVAEGEVCGCIMFISPAADDAGSDADIKLVRTAAAFLGKQMEG